MTKFCLLFFSILVAFSSCKKEEPELPNTADLFPNSEKNVRGSNDETVRMEYAKLLDMITFAYELDFMKMKKIDTSSITYPCGIESIDTLGGNLHVKFSGNCNSSIVTGKVIIEKLDTLDWWSDNSKILARITDFKVQIESNGEELVFNGYLTIENLYGGLISQEISSKRVIDHKIRGKLDIKFNNAETRNWSITKLRQYHDKGGSPRNIQLKVNADSNGTIAESGTNKYGFNFVTSYGSNLEYFSCNPQNKWIPDFTLAQGNYTYAVGTTRVNAEAGYIDENGYLNLVQNCASKGLKISWEFSNGTKEAFFEY